MQQDQAGELASWPFAKYWRWEKSCAPRAPALGLPRSGRRPSPGDGSIHPNAPSAAGRAELPNRQARAASGRLAARNGERPRAVRSARLQQRPDQACLAPAERARRAAAPIELDPPDDLVAADHVE